MDPTSCWSPDPDFCKSRPLPSVDAVLAAEERYLALLAQQIVARQEMRHCYNQMIQYYLMMLLNRHRYPKTTGAAAASSLMKILKKRGMDYGVSSQDLMVGHTGHCPGVILFLQMWLVLS
jgi:hypothetical protein